MRYATTHTPAPSSDVALRPMDHGLDGMYYPNRPGATSLRDAKPLYIGHDLVTVQVSGNTLTLFVGCAMHYQGPIPQGVAERYQVNKWAQEFLAFKINSNA